MCAHCESPEITRLNSEAYAALQAMLRDKQRTEVRRTTTPSAWRRSARFRPMGVR